MLMQGWQAITIWQNSLPDAQAVLLHVGAAPAIEVTDELSAGGSRAPLPVHDCVPLPPESQLLIALHHAHLYDEVGAACVIRAEFTIRFPPR